MKIHVIAATMLEVEPLIEEMNAKSYTLIITGVGATATAYQLAKVFSSNRPDLAIQAGIAGTFDPKLKPGMVCAIARDRFADLGVEEKGQWRDVFDMGLAENSEPPFQDGWLINTGRELNESGLPLVNGITVNEITTNRNRLDQLTTKYKPVVESMEGAAFHYVCLSDQIPFIQLRAISNHIAERDKSKWQINLAIEELNKTLRRLIERFGKAGNP